LCWYVLHPAFITTIKSEVEVVATFNNSSLLYKFLKVRKIKSVEDISREVLYEVACGRAASVKNKPTIKLDIAKEYNEIIG
jgi:hypothetical protein